MKTPKISRVIPGPHLAKIKTLYCCYCYDPIKWPTALYISGYGLVHPYHVQEALAQSAQIQCGL